MRNDLYFYLLVLLLGAAGVYYTNLNKDVHTASVTLAKSRQQVIANQNIGKDNEVQTNSEKTRSNVASFSGLKVVGIPTTDLDDLAKINALDTPVDSPYQNYIDKSSNSLDSDSDVESDQLKEWESSFTSWYLTLLRNKSSSDSFIGAESPERCRIDITVEKSKSVSMKLTSNSSVKKTSSSLTIIGLESSFRFEGISDSEKLSQRTLSLISLCDE